MLRLVIIAAALLLAGCASTEGLNAALNRQFAGHSANAFFLDYGMPANKEKLQNGGMKYRWVSLEPQPPAPPPQQTTQIIHTPRGNIGVAEASPRLPEPRFCEIRIEADKKGIIRKLSIVHDTEGNHSLSLCAELFGIRH